MIWYQKLAPDWTQRKFLVPYSWAMMPLPPRPHFQYPLRMKMVVRYDWKHRCSSAAYVAWHRAGLSAYVTPWPVAPFTANLATFSGHRAERTARNMVVVADGAPLHGNNTVFGTSSFSAAAGSALCCNAMQRPYWLRSATFTLHYIGQNVCYPNQPSGNVCYSWAYWFGQKLEMCPR